MTMQYFKDLEELMFSAIAKAKTVGFEVVVCYKSAEYSISLNSIMTMDEL